MAPGDGGGGGSGARGESGARGAYLESEELAAMGAAALLDISGALRTFFAAAALDRMPPSGARGQRAPCGSHAAPASARGGRADSGRCVRVRAAQKGHA